MATVQIFKPGMVGVVRDQPPHTLPPEAWTSAQNMRFSRKGAKKMRGERAVFGTPTVAPVFLQPVPTATLTYWLYANQDKIYVYEGGVHTNITRQTAAVDVDYTGTLDEIWNGTLLGGIPVLNNGVDVPQYWPALDITTKMAALPNWTSTLRAKVIRAFGKYLIALNLTDDGTLYPHAIQWSGPADPGSVPGTWDYTDPTTDAGRIELTDSDGGPLRDGVMLGNAMILYKANSTHALRYIGGNDVFAADLLLTSAGVLAPRCACAVDKGTKHFVVTESDVIIHSGQKNAESVIDEKNRDWLFDNIDATDFTKSYVFDNPRINEAWFVFPESGSSEVTTAAVYNYREKTWGFRQMEATYASYGLISDTAADDWDTDSDTWDSDADLWSEEGLRGVLLANKSRTLLQQLDRGLTINESTIVGILERQGLAIVGRDRQGEPKVDYRALKQINRVVPKVSGSGTLTVEVGVQHDFNEDVAWGAAQTFVIGTDKYVDLDPPVSGKLIAVRFNCLTSSDWQLEGYDLEMALLGNL